MEENLQSILSGIDPNNFQDENDRRMFARMSGISDKEYNDNFKVAENTDQGILDEVNSNFETNRIYNALSEDIIGNEIKKKSLELEEKEKSDMWNNFLEANNLV